MDAPNQDAALVRNTARERRLAHEHFFQMHTRDPILQLTGRALKQKQNSVFRIQDVRVPMRTIFYVFLLVLAMCNWTSSGSSMNESSVAQNGSFSTRQLRTVGYYTSWDAYSGNLAEEIRGELLTHINYAFANISDDGLAVLGDPCADIGDCLPARGDTASSPGGNFAQLLRLKERHPHLRALVAIGGWNWSGNFSDVALTPASRQRFVTSALELFLDRWPGLFDGFDLDWEYPVAGGRPENKRRPEDWENYTLLLDEFRRQLEQRGAAERRYLLTVALPAQPQGIADVAMVRVGELVDWINLMTYDYHTGGDIAHFNAPLRAAPDDPTPDRNVHATVQRYLEAGVPPEKITVGLPFFGYGYSGVASARDGLFQQAERNTAQSAWGVGTIRFWQLRNASERNFRRFWHPQAQVPWLYNSESRIWISYDDSQSLGLKSDYVRTHNLGGVMIWELGGDDGTLLESVYRRLNSRDSHTPPP
jgi:chitinase